MKPALVLSLVSSITCLAAWDAEAKPAAPVHAPSASKVDEKPAPKAKAKSVGKHETKSPSKAAPKTAAKAKRAPKHAPKIEPKPVEKAHEVLPPVAWKIGDIGGITLQAKVSNAALPPLAKGSNTAPRPLASVAHFHASLKAKAAPEAKPGASAKKAPPKKSFWIAADPHVPLAIVDGAAIHSVPLGPKACGAEKRWAKPKSHWKAVDEWGQVTGSFEVSGSQPYDDMRCREVFFKGQPASQPPVLFVAEESGWKPGPSVAWTPSEKEARHFEHTVGAIDEIWVNGKPKGKAAPLGQRTLFFKTPANEQSGTLPTRWAVAGGPVLVVAYLGEHGHWKASEVKAPLGKSDAYKPVGVFDMNGDGMPEIVYHMSDGPNAKDNVLSLDLPSMSWIDAASSPGGQTR
jgi:hypothetical protein